MTDCQKPKIDRRRTLSPPAPLTPQQQALAGAWWPATYTYWNRRTGRAVRDSVCVREDLLGRCTEGLIRAAQTFDEARGVKFITWLAWWLRMAYNHGLRHHYHRKRGHGVITLALQQDDGSAACPHLLHPADRREPSPPRVAIANEELARCRALLTGRQWLALTRPLRGETLEEAAATLGVTKERARQIEKAALAKVRRALGEEGVCYA